MTELGHFIDFGSLNTQKKIYSSVGASVFYVKFVSSSSLSATTTCFYSPHGLWSPFFANIIGSRQDQDVAHLLLLYYFIEYRVDYV